jgi:hypothetical protein
MNYKGKERKENKKIKKYTNKIYFKDVDVKHLKINVLNILKKKYKYQKNKKNYLLSNDGIYTFNNNSIQKYEFVTNILNETNQFIEVNQYNKFKTNLYQIPFDHERITIITLSFNIDDNILNFELINNKINDFYTQTNSSLNILDILLIKEMSYIKKLII